MALRFQLLNDILGPFIIEKNDPIDINAISQTVKRSEENDGVIYEIIIDIEFIKEGRDYIKKAYEQCGGIDAQVSVNVYERDPNAKRWKLYFSGQINFNKYELSETGVGVAIEQTGFQRRVLNLMDTDIDLETEVSENGTELPEASIIDLSLHSKTIRRQFATDHGFDGDIIYTFLTGLIPIQETLIGDNLGVGESRKIFFIPPLNPSFCDEIEERIDYSKEFRDTNPVEDRFFQFKIKESGSYSFTIDAKYKIAIAAAKVGVGGRGTCDVTVNWFLMHGTWLNYTLQVIGSDVINVGPPPSDGFTQFTKTISTFTYTTDLEISDEVYIFCQIEIQNTDPNSLFGEIHLNPGEIITVAGTDYPMDDPNFLNIKLKLEALTNFEATTTRAMLIHNAMERTLQYYTNQEVVLKSDLLGRTDIGYDEDGQYGLIAITNGSNIRNLVNSQSGGTSCIADEEEQDPKKIFASFKQLNDFINSVSCTGFGFETINNTQVLRLEKRSYFYDKDTRILSLGKVYNIRKRILSDNYYNRVDYGYAGKIDTRNVNGIDEFNTVRKSSIPIVNTKNVLNIQSNMKASGYQIEAQRRLKYSTEDGPNDDELFAIVSKRDGDNYVAKKNEGYSSIENVIDPETGYNYDISPAHNLENWYQFIASGLTRSFNKILKFVSGEVNYNMITTKTGEDPLPENGNVDLSNVEPIWDNEEYELDGVPFTRQMMDLVKANPYGYIEFFDLLDNKMEGFVKVIDHDSNKKQAHLLLLKVFRPQ